MDLRNGVDSVDEKDRIKSRTWKIRDDKVQDSNIASDPDDLIFELRTYQTELERQNEELKKAHKELNDSKRKYLDLYDLAPVGYLTLDENGIIKRVNLTGADMLEISRENIFNTAFINFVAPDYKKIYHKHIKQVLESRVKKQCEMQLISNNGLSFFVSLTTLAVMEETGDLEGVLIILTDISQRKKIEIDLQESLQEKEITSQVVMQLVGVTSTSEIYSVIGNAITKLLPNSYVIVSGISHDKNHVRVMDILGPSNYFDKLEKVLGISPFKMEFLVDDISKEELKKHKSEELTQYKDGFYSLTLHKLSRPLCRMIEKIFHIGEIHSIRFSFEGKHYGGVSIALLEGQSMDHKKAIEVIVNQASIVIRRSLAEEAIKKSLTEKEALIREVHHRVKNNMQVVSSLLNLQTQQVEGEEAKKVLLESQNRVKSIAILHEKSFQSSDLNHVKFNEYIPRIVADLFYSYHIQPEQVKQVIEVEDVTLNIETAVPCGLIISELVSNSLKHAFPPGKKGEIHVSLESNDKYTLIISDNGIGLPDELDYKKPDTLGLQLVNSLVNQMDGEINLNKSHGTEFSIIFGELKYKKRI